MCLTGGSNFGIVAELRMKIYEVPVEIYERKWGFSPEQIPEVVDALNTWKERQTVEEGCRLRIEKPDLSNRRLRVRLVVNILTVYLASPPASIRVASWWSGSGKGLVQNI
jgi:hypothetical protein